MSMAELPQDTGPDNRPEAKIPERRAIIERRALRDRLATLVTQDMGREKTRAAVLAILKDSLAKGEGEIRQRFDKNASGSAAVAARNYLVDQLIRVIYDFVTEHIYPLGVPSTGELLSLVAVGGYGRGELAPQSDIDLLFLLPYKITPHSEQVVEEILYLLWDLGFKVGHATRSADDCIRQAKADHTICTSLLEARWLWGDQGLYADLRQRFDKDIRSSPNPGKASAKFIEAKLSERAARHKRLGASRYVLEPNIKEGKGGLRDLHTLFWLAKFLYCTDDIALLVERGVFTKAELRRFDKARNFLLTLRCHLHYLTGRPEERLTFDLQKDIAALMGYSARAGVRDVERFMKHYFLVAKDVGDLTRIFCSSLEAEHNRRSRFRVPLLVRNRSVGGFRLEGDRLTVKGPEVFTKKSIEMLRIFHVAQEHDLDIHPQTLLWITQNLKKIDKGLRVDKTANQIFIKILTSAHDPEVALRRLNEAGVLGRFVPDFGRVVAQMQYNMYHHYTVDEHTIFAIGILHRIEQGHLKDQVPVASEVVHKIASRRVLYSAVLLHDIAKGRGGSHSELGAKVAYKLCPRLGLTGEETETVAWLVLHHLAMSDTAFKRDINDPKTIQDFADLVQSPERLRLLLVLTVADIRAVGPNVWNAWKAALLRDLYWRTEELLSGVLAAEGRAARVTRAKEALRALLTAWPKKDIEAHLARGYDSYWLSLDTETHERHARLVQEAEKSKAPLTIDTRIDRYREVTEVTIYTPDHAGLFSRIAGAMAVSGASIGAARIFTLVNGMALDSFYVRDAQGGLFDRPDRLARLSLAIEQTFSGRLRPKQELARRRSTIPSRLRVFKVPPRVLIDNNASNRYTVIEINCRDRTGLLYEITLAIAKLNLMISGARIATYGERAVDVFYVQDALGSKIVDETKLKRIRKRLLAALEDSEDETATKTKARKTGAKGEKVSPSSAAPSSATKATAK